MKRLFAIPLVGVMLTALAVPALATDTLTKPETGTSFEVLDSIEKARLPKLSIVWILNGEA